MQTINHSEMAKYYMDKNGKNSPMASPSYKMVNATPRIRNLIMKTGGEPFSFWSILVFIFPFRLGKYLVKKI